MDGYSLLLLILVLLVVGPAILFYVGDRLNSRMTGEDDKQSKRPPSR